jgi:hypothetical protein
MFMFRLRPGAIPGRPRQLKTSVCFIHEQVTLGHYHIVTTGNYYGLCRDKTRHGHHLPNAQPDKCKIPGVNFHHTPVLSGFKFTIKSSYSLLRTVRIQTAVAEVQFGLPATRRTNEDRYSVGLFKAPNAPLTCPQKKRLTKHLRQSIFGASDQEDTYETN